MVNTAIFYDVENLISLFNTKNSKTLQLDEIYRRILDLEEVSGVSVQRAYADWMLPVNRNLRSYLLQIGIEPVQIFNTNQNDKLKNAADVSLIIDAVDLISRRQDIENFVIASGDGIYAFLAKKLHEYGKRVIGCGFERNSNVTFKNSCDIFLPLENNDPTLTATVKNATKGTILYKNNDPEYTAAPAPAPQPEEEEISLPTKLPKNEYSEILVQSDLEIFRDADDVSGTLLTIKKIIELLFQNAEDDTNIKMSLFKTYVDYYLPNFRVTQYGFMRFGVFMQFLVSASPYCLLQPEKTIMLLTRRNSSLARNTEPLDDIRNLQFNLLNGKVAKSLFDIDYGTTFSIGLNTTPSPSRFAKKPIPTMETTRTVSKPEPKQKLKPGPKPGSKRTPKSEPKAAAKTPKKAAAVQLTGELDYSITIRKYIKGVFEKLSAENRLTATLVKKLTTVKYSEDNFGIRTPIFKRLNPDEPLQEQRVVNGIVKYWKNEFIFNDNSYLIFKEWADKQHHRERIKQWVDQL
ncbi:MAG: NYN domain-containing protein [Turicibacter sp.]|nr:NYN domain-containing protein [Turicibacter sp.]